jgi:hypothetical protein
MTNKIFSGLDRLTFSMQWDNKVVADADRTYPLESLGVVLIEPFLLIFNFLDQNHLFLLGISAFLLEGLKSFRYISKKLKSGIFRSSVFPTDNEKELALWCTCGQSYFLH